MHLVQKFNEAGILAEIISFQIGFERKKCFEKTLPIAVQRESMGEQSRWNKKDAQGPSAQDNRSQFLKNISISIIIEKYEY